jgi:hypothetical protein
MLWCNNYQVKKVFANERDFEMVTKDGDWYFLLAAVLDLMYGWVVGWTNYFKGIMRAVEKRLKCTFIGFKNKSHNLWERIINYRFL